mgnify:CR=1 FL=1
MFSRILGAGCLAACLSVLACFLSLQSAQAQSSFPMDRFIDSNLSKVQEKDLDRAADREYVCTSIGGFRFDGGYIMYIQPNVRVHTGERVDFLHGFYVQYTGAGTCSISRATPAPSSTWSAMATERQAIATSRAPIHRSGAKGSGSGRGPCRSTARCCSTKARAVSRVSWW